MAGAFTNQPRTTPITNQQLANQLGNGDFSQFNQGMQPGMGGGINPGGIGGGMGPGGNIYPLGGGMAHTTFYAVVASGLPIIRDPKTGEPYPPGHIPTIQDPNTWEQWRPGDSWVETMELANATLAEDLRMIQEIAFRPLEEMAANIVAGAKKDVGNAGKKWVTGAAEKLYGKDNETLKGIQQRGAEASKQAINQAPKIAQQAVKQAPQAAQKAGQAAQRAGQAAMQSANQVSQQASKFVSGGNGGARQPSAGEMRSALTSVAGDRSVFSARRN